MWRTDLECGLRLGLRLRGITRLAGGLEQTQLKIDLTKYNLTPSRNFELEGGPSPLRFNVDRDEGTFNLKFTVTDND